MFPFYSLALIIVFFGVLINIPGSLHINALLLHFYEPHKVLLFSTIFLTLGAMARTVVFWKEIKWGDALPLTIYGALGGFVGGYFVANIPNKIIAIIFILSGMYYLYKYFRKDTSHHSHAHVMIAGFVTALLQAFGVSVGSLRQGYLFAKGYTLQQVQGTVAVTFVISGGMMIIARLFHEKISIHDIYPMLILFPFMLITMYIAKHILYKLPKKLTDMIIVYSLIVSLLIALPKVIELLQ
jgi:uncharacterized membrane protein YfcA